MGDDNVIFVRYWDGTYLARWKGKRATGREQYDAAKRVAKKVLGDQPFSLKALGTRFAWEVIENVTA